MKKLSRIAGLLAATALLFSAMGCSDGGSSGGSSDGGETGDGTPIDTPARDPRTVVNATWNFRTNITGQSIASGKTNETATFTSIDFTGKGTNDIDNTNTIERGAVLKVVGGSNIKWKGESDTEYGLYTGNKTSGTMDNDYKSSDFVYGKLELTLNDSAAVTLKVSGNGDAAETRWVVVENSSGKIVGKKNNLSKTSIQELVLVQNPANNLLSAGKYTIYMNGSRLNSVTAKNALTEDVEDIPVETVTLSSDKTSMKVGGAAANLIAVVGPATVNVDYTVEFEVTEGADYVTVTKDTTDQHKATVTVNDTVDAEHTVKIVAKAGEITSDEVTITVDKASDVQITPYTEKFENYAITADATEFPYGGWKSTGNKTEGYTEDKTNKLPPADNASKMTFESAWYTGAAGATYYFSNGVSITEGGSTADTKFATKSATVGNYSGTNCIQLGKKSNGSYMTIPVEGDCVIRIIWNNNKSIATTDSDSKTTNNSRGLYATPSATGATIASLGGCDDYKGSQFYGYKANTAYTAANEIASFEYKGDAGTVKIECCGDNEGTSAGGACYIYLIDVAAE